MTRTRLARIPVLALVAAAAIACGSDDEPDAGPLIDASVSGTFTMSWSLTDGGASLLCDDVAADLVRVSLIEVNSIFGSVVTFSCDAGMATSRGFEAGTYRLQIDLRTVGGRSLLAAPLQVNDVEITIDGNTTVDPQTFTVIPQGSLEFRVGSVGVASSCTDIASGGAGILNLQFHLRQGATCVPTTFTVAAGGLPGGTYVSDCTNATTFPCIESDQLISVPMAPSGSRSLEVIGVIEGDVPCRRNQTQFIIPGNNLDVSLGQVGLDIDNLPPGCEGI